MIVEIKDRKFDLENKNDCFYFLKNILLDKRNYGFLTQYLFLQFLDEDINEYSSKILIGERTRGHCELDTGTIFGYFIKDYNLDNVFNDYLIHGNDNETVKKQNLKSTLTGLTNIIDFYWDREDCSAIEYIEKNKLNLSNEIDKNNVLVYILPSYFIFKQLRTIYDLIWDNFDVFIDKNSTSFNLFYSNKSDLGITNVPKLKKEPENLKSRERLLEILIGKNAEDLLVKFLNFERGLSEMGFINDARDTWTRESTALIRFYKFCRDKKIFKNYFDTKEDRKIGFQYLCQLYNHSPHKDYFKVSKMNSSENAKTKRSEFAFLLSY